MQLPPATLVVLAALALSGCDDEAGPRVSSPDVDPELASYAGLEVGVRSRLQIVWESKREMPLRITREALGWHQRDGKPQLRLEYRSDYRRHPDLLSQEWLSWEGSSLVCTARQVGPTLHTISPPQPLLKLPLQVGSGWDWQGLIGSREARTSFKILEKRADKDHGQILVVEQQTISGKFTSTRVVTYALQRGVVSERADFPWGELASNSTTLRAALQPEEDGEAR